MRYNIAKMKSIWTFLLLLILFFNTGVVAQNFLEQNLPTQGGEVVYLKVDESPELPIHEQVHKVNNWFSQQHFPYSQVSENDKSRDIVSGQGKTMILWGPNDFEQYYKEIKFAVQIVVKKDRYQYRLDQFIVKDGASEIQLEIYKSDDKNGIRYNPHFYKRIDEHMNKLISSLDEYMGK